MQIMKDFNYYLDTIGEVGYVTEVFRSVVYVSGLPKARPNEMVVFESGEIGQVLSLKEDNLEVLLFTYFSLTVGSKVARCGDILKVKVGEFLIGHTISPLGEIIDNKRVVNEKIFDARSIDVTPFGLTERTRVKVPLETGVPMVDLMLPIGLGQRQLVVGNRRTGKSEFLLQVVLSQATKGSLCIYCAIGKRMPDVKNIQTFIEKNKLTNRVITVVSASNDPSGMIFVTPYTAMTIAEYFR